MPKKESYWVDRADKRMELAHKNSDQTIQEINSGYDKAIKDINEDIKNIFYNFANSEGMDKGKAAELLSQRVSRKTIADIRARVNTVQDETIKRELINRLNAQAYKARITRLEALKESIYINSKQIVDSELSKSTSLYTKTIKDTYYRNIFDNQKALGYVYEFATMPNETISEILKNNWSGKHYSSRIWDNSDVFASKLEEIMTNGLMGGKSSVRTAKDLAEYAEVGKFVSERLIRTETTYVSTMADLEGSKTRGTKKLKFKATLDGKTSDVCRTHDGNIVGVDEAVPGDTIPPLHCFCRSVMIDIIEGLEHKTRMARDPKTGKNYKVPADMTYPQWYDKHVIGKTRAEYHDLIGINTRNKTKITSVSNHAVDRAIQRNVSAENAKEALLNPLKIGNIKVDEKGLPSQKYIGEKATCSVNPDTGVIIQVNPTGSRYAKRLKRSENNVTN